MSTATKPKHPHLVIRASAGSGKTFQLSNRFIGLLNDNVPVDQILATTFTRKAAGEIFERIMERLAKAATSEKERAELAEFIHDKKLTQQRCLELLERVTRNLHRLRVSTLDSFFAEIAGSFSLELGLPPGWEIVDELTDKRLRKQAIETVLHSDSETEVSRLMNLLAKGEADRNVSELVRSTVNNLYVLFQETEADAWHQIPRRKQLSQPELADALKALSSVALPDDNRFAKARQTDCERATSGDWEALIGSGLAAKVHAGESKYCRKDIPSEAQAAYRVLLDHAQAVLLGQLANQTEATYELLKKFDTEYQRLKFEHRALRFEDVTRCLGDVKALGGVDRLAFRMDGGISHLLLDEFQDTSLPQWEAIRLFAEKIIAAEEGSFFCVGDTKQAIFGWRGGVAEIFDALQAHLTGVTEDRLEKSFRSSQPVIDAVNIIFTGLTKHNNLGDLESPVRSWCNQFKHHETAKAKLPGYVTLETAPAAGEDEDQGDVTLQFAADRVAETIKRAPGKTVGVLVRQNKTVARLIYELRQRGVPASEEGGNPLTDSAAVQLILSLLRLAEHPGNSVARFHLGHSLLGKALGIDLDQGGMASAAVAKKIRADLLAVGYGPAIRKWAEQLVPDCSRREVSRLKQLIELAYQFEPAATLRPSDFIDLVESEKIADPATADVRVMTIHQAKGLQFDVVMLAELDVGIGGQADACAVGRETPISPITAVCLHRNSAIRSLLPERLQQMFQHAAERDVSEALCVLYVSVTRPIHALHMIIAPSKPNERSLHKTFAGLLRAALVGTDPVPESTVLFKHGEQHWYKSLAAPAGDVSKTEDEKEDKPLTVVLPKLAMGRRRGLEAASPSQLEGGSAVKVGELLHPARAGAMNRGTIIHAWFEEIRWLDDGMPDDETLRQIAVRHDTTGIDVSVLIKQLHGMLQSEAIAGCLKRSAYLPPAKLPFAEGVQAELAKVPLDLTVLTEQSIAARVDTSLMTGSIDRLVLIRQGGKLVGADVIDFKTDAIEPGDETTLDEKIDFYRPQIDAYQRAVSKMFRIESERIAGRLLFVSVGKIATLSTW